jgi:hypothetical protein
MSRLVLASALLAALTVFFAFAGQAQEAWISLKGGNKARILSATESVDAGKRRQLVASFVLSEPGVVADHARVIEIADQLFARVVLVPADQKGFKRVLINLLAGEGSSADGAVQKFEGFSYVRRSNGVWLRQAGPEPWKVAQDPKWVPLQAQLVQLSTGAVYVDFIGEIFAPAGSTKALGIEMRSSTPATNIPGKYAEIRELWTRLAYDKLKTDGFDFVHIDNFTEPQRGRFHVRQRVYLDIRRPEGGDWPELPGTAPLEGAKEPLVAGTIFEDDSTRFALAAVGSAGDVRSRSEAMGGATVGVAERELPRGLPMVASDYLKPAQ